MVIGHMKSVAMVAAAVHTQGSCTYERSCLFIVMLVDFWTYAAPEKNKTCHKILRAL